MPYKLPGVLVSGGLVVGSGAKQSRFGNFIVTFVIGAIVGWLLGRL